MPATDVLDRLRRIDLNVILIRLEATQDKYDRKKWYTSVGQISVSGYKFYNWNRCVGGGGAIDLVMHLLDCDFKTAFAWLDQRFSDGFIAQDSKIETHKPSAVKLPERDDSKLASVLHYLVAARRIRRSLIEPLIDSARIYADKKANAVFLLLGKEKRAVGAELRGTDPIPWRGMAPGSRKDLGFFSVGPDNPTKIILCESAIDAISCFHLHPDCLVISTSGANPSPPWLGSLLHQGFEILCAFDSDKTGDTVAQKMMESYPTIKRLRPQKHDWNDVLKSLNSNSYPSNITSLRNPL